MKNQVVSVSVLFLLLCLAGCALQNKPTASTTIYPPSTYDSAVSKENMAEWKWKDVFKDQYLINLIDSALVKNPDLGILLQEIEMQRAAVLRAKGSLAPNLNLNLIPAIRRYGLYTMDGAGNISTNILPGKIVPINLPDQYLGLQSSWEVDLWGKLKNRKRAALARMLSSMEGRKLAVTQLVAEIAGAYCSLIATDQQIKMIDEMRLIQQRSFAIVERQKEAGLTNDASTPRGRLVLDDGAVTAILERGVSLLPAGVTAVEGEFISGDTVELVTPDKKVIARGLVAFDSEEIPQMLGRSTKDLAATLGAEYERELVHRDDLVLL